MNEKVLTRNMQQEIGDLGHSITDAIGRAIAVSILADGNTSNRTQPATTSIVATPATSKVKAETKAELATTEQKIVEQARQRERERKAQDTPVGDPLGIVDGVHVAPGIVLTAVDNETQTITLRASFAIARKVTNKSGTYDLYAHTVSQGLQQRVGGYVPLSNSGLSLSLKLARFPNK